MDNLGTIFKDEINDYIECVKLIHAWQYGDRSGFYSRLLSLYQIADSTNKVRLEIVYPHLFKAFHAWEQSDENGNELFKRYDLPCVYSTTMEHRISDFAHHLGYTFGALGRTDIQEHFGIDNKFNEYIKSVFKFIIDKIYEEKNDTH